MIPIVVLVQTLISTPFENIARNYITMSDQEHKFSKAMQRISLNKK